MSDSLWPHELQYARLPSPPLSPRTISNSCPSSNLIFVALFSCPQNFSASGSFPISWLFTSNDQSIGASASVLPMNIQGWFPLGLTALISLLSKRLSRVFSSTTFWKHQFFGAQPSLWSSSHVHTWLLEKPYLWLSEYIEDWIWVVPGRGVSMINPEKLERWSWPR